MELPEDQIEYNAKMRSCMQETRLEIALNLIKQVMMEEGGTESSMPQKLLVKNLYKVSQGLGASLNAFRQRSR